MAHAQQIEITIVFAALEDDETLGGNTSSLWSCGHVLPRIAVTWVCCARVGWHLLIGARRGETMHMGPVAHNGLASCADGPTRAIALREAAGALAQVKH